mgnify:CR=1 FL=1|tara:strand:+ start:409795 stop:410460 length:666 start_codon:yes stop_codon:yes gene_type:complete
MAEWNANKTRIIYESEEEFLEIQSGRTKDELEPYDSTQYPQVVTDLLRFYPYIEKNSLILDAGCRDGWTMLRMKEDGYNCVTGVDVVPRAIDFCHQRGLNASVQNIQEMDFDDASFDAAFCRHTLEHTINPKKALKEMARVVKPGGVVFVIIPIESGKRKLKARRKIKFGHSYVFEGDNKFLELIDDSLYKLVGRFHDQTIKYIASIFVLRRRSDDDEADS